MLTDEQIAHLAAELDVLDPHDPVWGEFARLVLNEAAPEIRRAERERCAAVCDSVNSYDNPMTATDCADAIRSLPDAG